MDIERRGRKIQDGKFGRGPVVYWMSREQRVVDNWALLWAQQEAIIRRKGLLVVFCLVANYPGANPMHYNFMLSGLKLLVEKLKAYNIGFTLQSESPEIILPRLLHKLDAHALVCDFDPLRIKRQWKEQLASVLALPMYEVDSHNIVPVWTASNKKEYAAYTIRPKLKRLMDKYLTDIPPLKHHPTITAPMVNLGQADSSHSCLLRQVNEMEALLQSGEEAALLATQHALQNKMPDYPSRRNNPCLDGQSGLSAYLHFGQLSPQRLAWLVSRSELSAEAKQTFLEELVVRRELADNFCYYEPNYDSVAGFPEWAKKTLDQHRNDTREFVYTMDELEQGKTHESLWNACQRDLVRSGKLHGYLRMYWAKKILEWTATPETAMDYAITLNDRYSLDGRDPNGYTGIAWSIGGVHDRAWRERPVFGKIRYMNEAGCRRKFDVEGYICSVEKRLEK